MKPEIKKAYEAGLADGKAMRTQDHGKANRILDLACEELGLTLEEMTDGTRWNAHKKMITMYILVERTRLMDRTIGLYFGKGRGAVQHAYRVIGEEYEIYQDVRRSIDEIEGKI